MTMPTPPDAAEPASRRRPGPLSRTELDLLEAYWRAANYLSVGQIYLLDNPLLREPLLAEHVKPRLLGHWGTTPGLNLIYAHMNRAIRMRELDAIYPWTRRSRTAPEASASGSGPRPTRATNPAS